MSDSGSDFFEDFCMIAGSHASSLDRLYAWEKKLYDEVKVFCCNHFRIKSWVSLKSNVAYSIETGFIHSSP